MNAGGRTNHDPEAIFPRNANGFNSPFQFHLALMVSVPRQRGVKRIFNHGGVCVEWFVQVVTPFMEAEYARIQ